MKPIAHIESGFDSKFGVPRQSSLALSTRARIVFEPEYRDPQALRGLEGFDYIWLIWEFSENGPRWSPTVRPPRLGGNTRMGVFATRSTFRPNALGLSSVKLESIENDPTLGPCIWVSGADLMDGTPIFDIKPYISYTDSHPDAACGWVDTLQEKRLQVEWAVPCPPELEEELTQILALDPRPAYIEDPDRIWGISYRGMDVRFKIKGTLLTVEEIKKG